MSGVFNLELDYDCHWQSLELWFAARRTAARKGWFFAGVRHTTGRSVLRSGREEHSNHRGTVAEDRPYLHKPTYITERAPHPEPDVSICSWGCKNSPKTGAKISYLAFSLKHENYWLTKIKLKYIIRLDTISNFWLHTFHAVTFWCALHLEGPHDPFGINNYGFYLIYR